MAARDKRDFSEILIRQGVITSAQLAEAKKKGGGKLAQTLVICGFASEEDVMRAMAEQHGVDYVNLKEVNIPKSVAELIPESLAREHAVLPLSADDGQITILISDPWDLETLDKLRFILNRRIEIALAPRSSIEAAINRIFSPGDGRDEGMFQEPTEDAPDFTHPEDEIGAGDNLDEASAPIVRLVHLLITEAVQLRASDIHVEPFENRIRVRYRIDGVLVERENPPKRLLGAILSRIKILARLDIAERRRTQDGRIKVTLGQKELDLRVSVIPTSHGQSVVMRILDKDSIKVGLKQLGFAPDEFKTFSNLIRRPN